MAKTSLRTFRILARVEVESWHDIKAESFEQAGKIAGELSANQFVEAKEEIYEFGQLNITSIILE